VKQCFSNGFAMLSFSGFRFKLLSLNPQEPPGRIPRTGLKWFEVTTHWDDMDRGDWDAAARLQDL
jgi:hypothetical protein